MGSKSRAGNNHFDREQYLRQHGFQPLRNGKGSHALWEHEGMKELAHKAGFKMPDTLKSSTAWQVVLPSDPAQGTWRAITNQVEAVTQCLDAAANREKKFEEVQRLREEFNIKAKQYLEWKKAVRHELKAGVSLSAAPLPFKELEGLRNQRNAYRP